MRHRIRSVTGRVLACVALAALLGSLIVPAPALAATRRPTLSLSTYTMYKAGVKSFKMSGSISRSLAGKKVRIEIKKPGRTYWSITSYRTISKSGKYSWSYTPRLSGRFYIRARYGTSTAGLSPTRSLLVKKGAAQKVQLRLASTTSTRDSGLFELLGPAFIMSCPEYKISAQWVGSGAAIALGGSGDADVLLTHSPAAERDFMNGIVAGNPSAYKGKTRYKVMYNDYVLVGPKTDPASIETSDSAVEAFGKIATTGSTFWSRNDNSGTNAKEKQIWAALSNPQIGMPWYKASGTMGMATCLAAANDATTGGYTLSDRGTWLMAARLGTVNNLSIAHEGDALYFNQYSVIEVDKATNWEGAMDFRQWLMTPKAQSLISTYGEYTYSDSLFTGNAGLYAEGE